ncbi:MAG: capsular biosynthesis protein [Alistipes sp.]|nr:capsular biosynthesis protein [Alistipes sp.]MDY4569777.1 GDSL-type esterase/lipase family protein [Alistipes senegalensis]
MKRYILLLLTTLFALTAGAQSFNEMIKLYQYASANAQLKADSLQPSVVFIGDSIFEIWMWRRAEFFTGNDYLNRGIGAQTSPQLLGRFRQDVIELHPQAVVLCVGVNDIAENSGPYSEEYTLGCIRSCAELARANGIKVILCSVLPAAACGWNPSVKGVPALIDSLNAGIKAYAADQGFGFVDFNTPMRDENGGLLKCYDFEDGVHPNVDAYIVMESLVKPVIERVLGQKNYGFNTNF